MGPVVSWYSGVSWDPVYVKVVSQSTEVANVETKFLDNDGSSASVLAGTIGFLRVRVDSVVMGAIFPRLVLSQTDVLGKIYNGAQFCKGAADGFTGEVEFVSSRCCIMACPCRGEHWLLLLLTDCCIYIDDMGLASKVVAIDELPCLGVVSSCESLSPCRLFLSHVLG